MSFSFLSRCDYCACPAALSSLKMRLVEIFNNVLELGIPRFLRYLKSRKEEAAMKKMGVEPVKLSEVGKQAKMGEFLKMFGLFV